MTDTRNVYLQHTLLSKRTLPVVVPTMDPRIDDSIAMIGGDSHKLSIPAIKEVVADTKRGGMWVNRTPGKVSRTGRYGSTPGDTSLYVRSKTAPSIVLIGSTSIYPACGISGSLQVGKKQ